MTFSVYIGSVYFHLFILFYFILLLFIYLIYLFYFFFFFGGGVSKFEFQYFGELSVKSIIGVGGFSRYFGGLIII